MSDPDKRHSHQSIQGHTPSSSSSSDSLHDPLPPALRQNPLNAAVLGGTLREVKLFFILFHFIKYKNFSYMEHQSMSRFESPKCHSFFISIDGKFLTQLLHEILIMKIRCI